jgi:hypothetical protein
MVNTSISSASSTSSASKSSSMSPTFSNHKVTQGCREVYRGRDGGEVYIGRDARQ